MKKIKIFILLFSVGICNAQNISGIWQYGDSIYADGATNYDFTEIKNGYYFTFTPSKYDELRSLKVIEGKCFMKNDSIVFYVERITLKSHSEWILTRRNKNDSIPHYMMELYYDTTLHSMENRNWPSLTNYWKLKENGKNYKVSYNPPLQFTIPFRYFKEGTYDVLEMDGDKFYFEDPAPDDYGTQIDNRDE